MWGVIWSQGKKIFKPRFIDHIDFARAQGEWKFPPTRGRDDKRHWYPRREPRGNYVKAIRSWKKQKTDVRCFVKVAGKF